ncbi:type I polyketide synthase [Paenibacillus shirakamiensis]
MDDDRQEWNSLISCTKFIDLIGCGTQRFDEWSWIPCLQRWIEQSSQEKYEIKFLCVTRGLENNRSQVNVSGASRVGLYRMLQSEYRYTHSRHIDIDINEDDYTLIEYIKAELNMESMDTEVRYAKGIRYRACLKEQEKNEELQCVRMSFSPDHVLWITGGTRGIGALCAEHFVKNYGVRRIVLMGKESIPPRHKWKSHLEDYGSSLGIKIEKILSLEGMGAQVKTLSVSLGDVEGLHQSVQHVTSEWGPIGGVLHCAGMESSDTPAFIRKSLTSIQEVALPKVEGLNHLYACLKDEPLRFFVLFSSVSATIPTLAAGQSDYAMANAYMDYFAQDQAAVTPIVSIQWPNWKDTGMGEVKSKAYKDTGLLSHTNEQGLQMLDYILSQGMGPVVLPAYIDRDNWAVERLMQSNKPQDQNSDASNFPAQNQSSKENENLSNIVRGLTRIFAQELKLDTHKIQPYVPFAHYGVDSILLAQVVKVIRQKSGVDLDPSLLFEYPTVDALAIYLQNNFPSSMDSLYLFGTSVMQPNTADEQKETEETYLVNTHDFGTLSEIAIIGMSCHFPEAPSLEKYWELLTKGESSIGQIPSEHSGEDGELFFAGVIDRTPTVASTYFQISTEDAAAMDPQALLLLEESLKTVYHAGYTPEELHEKSVGVYIGARSRHLPQEELLLAAKNPILAVGANYLASNISRFLDVKGPSLVIDSACSSALISMNLAIQALRNGDIEYALVGGINLFHTDKEHQLFKQRGLLSQDSEFHIFDRRSQGVILAEGAGMVLLKSKEQAQKDGDSILAVIKSVAVNNDGRTAGPSAPSYKGQCDVMRRALELSGKQPQEIDYIEANGSGSQVSDVLELKAIQAVYRTKSKLPLGIGSVKPNIGHSLCAEGMASLIKLILMLSHGQKVPFLSGQQPMKHFKIEDSALYFNRTSEKWSSPRVAGVSSFADGGTNAHLILESYEEDSRTTIRRSLPLPSDLFELPKATSDRKGNRRMVWESFGLEG